MEKHVLVIDESAIVRKYVRLILEDNGFVVSEADSGETGLEQARELDVDMFIIDVDMPGMNGREMLAQVRELPEHARTPAFFLSTESATSSFEQSTKVVSTVRLVQPFHSHIMLKGIREVLGA